MKDKVKTALVQMEVAGLQPEKNASFRKILPTDYKDVIIIRGV